MAEVVQNFLRENSIDDLQSNYAIKAKPHVERPNLVLLKYNQLESPMGLDIVQKCRGIILDCANDWDVVCRTYDKFFNYGEGHAAKIDWSTARVYEKLDGSLMQLYFYDGGWHVSSSGMPCASGNIMNTDKTFRDLFWKVWGSLGYRLPIDTNVCYAFEMMTPYNRVVVRHSDSKLVLHGARRLSDFKELDPIEEARNNGWESIKTYALSSWNDVMEAAKNLDPMDSEGFVVCDANYNRVKVKSPAYVAVAHMKDGFTTRRMLEIVRTNENSEFLSYYPEYTDLFYEVKCKYDALVEEISGFYSVIKDIEHQKDFAMKAKDQKYSGVLFGMRNGKDLKSYLAGMNIRALEDWLGLKSIEL